jgi:large subunit ribosomal protein L24
MHIKKGDIVKVRSGDDKGKTGKVTMALPRENKVVVEGINVMKKHERPRQQGKKGQLVERAMPISVSNVMKAEGAEKKEVKEPKEKAAKKAPAKK